MKYSFGIDLAGYSTGKTRIARLQKHANDSNVNAVLLKSSALSKKINGNQKQFHTIIQNELDELAGYLKLGNVYVDIPVDLQQLGQWNSFDNLWEQTNRPVDYALNAMPPLADRIGSPVARFQTIMALGKTLGGAYDIASMVGTRIFETYPAASLRFSNITARGYKNFHAIWQHGAWIVYDALKKIQSGESPFAVILAWLKLQADCEGFELTNDDLDAIIAGLPGLVSPECLIRDEALESIIAVHLERKHATTKQPLLPLGFVIVKEQPFARITVTRAQD